MAHQIHTTKACAALAPRTSPYYAAPVAAGLYLGVRRLPDGGSWVGRYRPANGETAHRTLGTVAGLGSAPADDAMDHAEASAALLEWLQEIKTGRPVSSGLTTVADVAFSYLEDLRMEGEDANADDAEARLRLHLLGRPEAPKRYRAKHAKAVAPHPLARRPVDEVTRLELKAWKGGLRKADGQKPAPATVNRNIAALIAALNYGAANGMVNPSRSVEWEAALKKSDTGNRRELYLDRNERRALIKAAHCESDEFGALVEAATYTGARFGELRDATVADFDARQRVLRVDGKTGPRPVPLSDEAVALFTRVAKGKAKADALLPNPEGNPWKNSEHDRPMTRAAELAKLPEETCLYTLRHSWITQALIGQKVGKDVVRFSVLTVARMVGTSAAMIDKHYGHLATSEAEVLRGLSFA